MYEGDNDLVAQELPRIIPTGTGSFESDWDNDDTLFTCQVVDSPKSQQVEAPSSPAKRRMKLVNRPNRPTGLPLTMRLRPIAEGALGEE